MTEKQTTSKWTGLNGKIMAWFCNSPLRTLIEVWLLGLPRTAFLSEVSNSIHSNEVILDMGAGSGYFSLAIARKLSTGKVICLDLSEEMLSRLERKAEKEGIKDKIQILCQRRCRIPQLWRDNFPHLYITFPLDLQNNS